MMSTQRYKDTEIKGKISEKLEIGILDSGKLAQAITKSSRTREILHQSTKMFVGLDNTISNTEQSLQMMHKTLSNLESKSSELHKSLGQVEHLRNHTDHILSTIK